MDIPLSDQFVTYMWVIELFYLVVMLGARLHA
ncbi:uncharacterized protein METZ01_LOCUS394148 [marine metagenome]|uniref:Uncharacterized protein n=1 Tax=marine metagenome TaxID=408172 RepID=A0A382V4A1_9ZZZZ